MRKSTKRQSYISDEKIRHICASVIGVDLFKEPEWNGAGLPPVGAECEVNDVDHGWISATVIAHDYSEVVVVCKTLYGYDGYGDFRPIRTPEQRERDEVVETARAIIIDARSGSMLDDILQALYDAGMLREAGE